ncbi:polymer-forming cytoskeletal protein [Vibrio hannami]|uniref:polymer-forming cytoskeletal protein n=1 Tax=Vibrio hannami TaxID=2717094 RepID=UPI00240EE957|nr:polymer-forming cytoskeletal protein [Vibrio hannami]MDG3085445.1 polymer-forming cytoskeletal protein [Vibrio hannami]
MCKKQLLTAAITIALSAGAAGELVEFQSGDVIQASTMNSNFTYLKNLAETSNRGVSVTDSVDCTSDSTALAQYFNTSKNVDFLIVELTGSCDWQGVNLNRPGIMIRNGSINGDIFIDSLQRVGFVNVAVNGGITYSGNANGWLEGVTGNGSTELTVHGGSRVWLGSNNTGFAEISVQDGSSLQTNDPISSSVLEAVAMSSVAVPQVTGVNEVYIEASSIFVWQDDNLNNSGMLDSNSVVVEEKGHLVIEGNAVVGGEVITTHASSLVVRGDVNASDFKVHNSSSAQVDGDIAATGLVEARSASSLTVDGAITSPDVGAHNSSNLRADSVTASTTFAMQHSSSADVRTIDVGNFFCRTSSLYNDVSFTSTTKDLWGFCYMEAAFDMGSLCGNTDQSGPVLGWSTTAHNSFPGDCP